MSNTLDTIDYYSFAYDNLTVRQFASSYHNKALFLALCICKECSGCSLPRILATSTSFSLLRGRFLRHRLPEAASLGLILYIQ